MKISFVLPANLLNGGIRVIGILAAELVVRGHDVQVFLQPHKSYSWMSRLKMWLRTGQLPKPPQDGPFLDALTEHTTTLDRRRPIVDSDLPDADVVIATWWETAPWVAELSPAKGAKVYFMQDYGARGQEIEKIIPTFALPFAFVTLTQYLRHLILKENPSADVTVMTNAVDTTLFEGPSRLRNVPPKIGFIYRDQPTKGMDTAQKALEMIRSAIPDVTAIAVCAVPPELPDWIEIANGPDDHELAEIYRACDLWLFPSRMEGFGLPILEAMASRTPVISTKVGGAPDIIIDGENGFLVDIDDATTMAHKAIAVLTGPEDHWHQIAAMAQSKIVTRSWEDAADEFEAALQSAVAQQ